MLLTARRRPALPLDEAGKYVAGAYVVFLALIARSTSRSWRASCSRIERELGELRASSPSAAPTREAAGPRARGGAAR